MKQQKPILHGRDHHPDGVDPIPGLNGGGGLGVDWEDVGTTAGLTLALKNPRILYASEAITNVASGINFTQYFPNGTIITNDDDGTWVPDTPISGPFVGEAFDVRAAGVSPRIHLIKPGLYLAHFSVLASFYGASAAGPKLLTLYAHTHTAGDTKSLEWAYVSNYDIDFQKEITTPGSTGSSKTPHIAGVMRVPGEYPGPIGLEMVQHSGVAMNLSVRMAVVWVAQYNLA